MVPLASLPYIQHFRPSTTSDRSHLMHCHQHCQHCQDCHRRQPPQHSTPFLRPLPPIPLKSSTLLPPSNHPPDRPPQLPIPPPRPPPLNLPVSLHPRPLPLPPRPQQRRPALSVLETRPHRRTSESLGRARLLWYGCTYSPSFSSFYDFSSFFSRLMRLG